jgi:hypothetical protein
VARKHPPLNLADPLMNVPRIIPCAKVATTDSIGARMTPIKHYAP